MNIIDRSALRIAQFIRSNNPDAGSEIALRYSLSLLINTLSAMFIILIICLISGHFFRGLTVILIFTFMRYVSGGFHLTSSLACCLMTIIVMTALAHIDYPYFYTGLIFDIASFFLLLWKAPEGIENVSRIHPKYYPVLKVIALLSVSSNFFLHSSLLSSVFLTQSLTLLQVSYRIFDIIERRVAR